MRPSVVYGISIDIYLHLTAAPFEVQFQDHAQFASGYLQNGGRSADRTNITLAIKNEVVYKGFRLALLDLTLTLSNGQCQSQGHAHSDCEFL